MVYKLLHFIYLTFIIILDCKYSNFATLKRHDDDSSSTTSWFVQPQLASYITFGVGYCFIRVKGNAKARVWDKADIVPTPLFYTNSFRFGDWESIIFTSPRMATVRDYSWKYELVDLGLSVRWTDRNFMADSSFLNGQYLPYGWDVGLSENYKFTLETYEAHGFGQLDQMIDSGSPKINIVASGNDRIFNYNKQLRLPTLSEIEELIRNCHWAVVFRHDEKEAFRKPLKRNGHYYDDQIQNTWINRELKIYLDEGFAIEETIESIGDYDLLSSEVVNIRDGERPKLIFEGVHEFDLCNKPFFYPYYLVAYKTNPHTDGIKFPFSGYCEFDACKNKNIIYNSASNGKNELYWSVEIPSGDVVKLKGKYYIAMLKYLIGYDWSDLNPNSAYFIPSRPIIESVKDAWIGRNYRGVENIEK